MSKNKKKEKKSELKNEVNPILVKEDQQPT